MTLTARIESDGPYARLDEQGKYQLRALFDLSTTQHTQASIPMRRVAPYGGPCGSGPNESNVGFHTPLHDGDEVLISCLNGDPDRPMVVGTLPNPERLSPVTSTNPSQNRLRTMSDNELTFDDTKEKEAITLRTYSGYNILHLNHEAVGHKVRLATEHGAMVTFAKKTIHRHSDDTMTERVGNDRLVKVKNYHRTETQTKEIHHQAKTDHKHSAYKNIQTESGKNTELQTGRHMIMDVADNTRITIKGSGGLFATVKSNDVFIQSANKIDVKGQGGGDITFEQSGGGFKVSSGGVVSFYGKKVFFGGSGGVQLNGKVNYSVPGPNPPGAVSTQAPIAFAGIDEIVPQILPELQSTYAHEQLVDLAGEMSESAFILYLIPIFGKDLPASAYSKLYRDLNDGKVIPPEHEVGPGIAGSAAAYNQKTNIIRISYGFLDSALKDEETASALLLALVEEYGHYIDDLLRTVYSKQGGDAMGDEGAHYSYQLMNTNIEEQPILHFADANGPELVGALKVDFSEVKKNINKYVGPYRHDVDGKLGPWEFFGAGMGGHEKDMSAYGHQSIELVLKNAGFKDEELIKVYFGNWLRDYSQMIDPAIIRPTNDLLTKAQSKAEERANNKAKTRGTKPEDESSNTDPTLDTLRLSRQAITKIVGLLALKEFAKFNPDFAQKVYELLFSDNGMKILGLYRPEEHIDNHKPADENPDDPTLIDKGFRKPPTKEQLSINTSTGLKNYIATPTPNQSFPTATQYMVERIEMAMKAGRTEEGFRYFGEGLHVLEDFFSHSNFVEVSLIKLGFPVDPWVDVPENTNRIPITTGRFGQTDVFASIGPKLAELFPKEIPDYTAVEPGERTPTDQAILIVLEDLANSQQCDTTQGNSNYKGNFNACWTKKKYDQYLWLRDKMAAGKADYRIKWLFEGAHYAISSALFVSNFMMHYFGKLSSASIDDAQSIIASGKVGTDPTHSQLAKDHHDRALHELSALLAKRAVEKTGLTMLQYWKGNHEKIPSLVAEQFITHPLDTEWMHNIITDWAPNNMDEIRRAQSRDEIEHLHKEYGPTLEKGQSTFEAIGKSISEIFK